jgi:hypothetical protein
MAAGATYEKLATTTLGSNQATITFSSISGSYTDLVLIVSANQTPALNTQYIRFNGDTGTNYSYTILAGNGTSAVSARGTTQDAWYSGYYGVPPTSNFGTEIYSFQNYANTTTFKTGLSRTGRASGGTDAMVGLWRNTAAITSITYGITGISAFLTSGSTFTLYGIAAA